MPKQDNAYIMTFVAHDGGIYAVHPTDDLKSAGTIEYIDFKFTLPHSYYIFVWRRDRKNFTAKEAETVRKFVEWDMEDFINSGDEDQDAYCKVVKKLTMNKNCLILAWDKMILPEDELDWSSFVDDVREATDEELGNIAEGMSAHDKELAVYEGRIFENETSREFLR